MESMIVWWLLRLIFIAAMAYGLLIAFYTLGWYKLKKAPPLLIDDHPMVTVIVALRNEADHIAMLINGFTNQQYPNDKLSFILVDDHSEDNTKALLTEHTNHQNSQRFMIVEAEKTGKKHALQQALGLANGELIIVTDADCQHEPNWVARLATCFRKQQAVMILAPVKIHPVSGFFQQLQALEFLSLIASTAGSSGIGFPSMANGANMAFDRNAVVEAGGFVQHPDIASGDDVFLLLKLLSQHGSNKITFLMDSESVVTTKGSPDLLSFFRQRMRWVSKSKAYRHPNIIIPAMLVFIFNFLLALMLLGSIFLPYLLLVYLLFIVLKLLIDMPLLQAAATFMKSRKLLRWSFFLQLIYPVYVVITAFSGLLVKSKWKGRLQK